MYLWRYTQPYVFVAPTAAERYIITQTIAYPGVLWGINISRTAYNVLLSFAANLTQCRNAVRRLNEASLDLAIAEEVSIPIPPLTRTYEVLALRDDLVQTSTLPELFAPHYKGTFVRNSQALINQGLLDVRRDQVELMYTKLEALISLANTQTATVARLGTRLEALMVAAAASPAFAAVFAQDRTAEFLERNQKFISSFHSSLGLSERLFSKILP